MTTSPYLWHLTPSSLKRRLLVYFFTRPEARLYLREIAHLIQVDPANLSRELKNLEAEGLFIAEQRGLQKFFSLNRNYPHFHEIKTIISKMALERSVPKPALGGAVSKNKDRLIYVIAGPNGAGKTTFAKKFLPEYAHCNEFVNADLIASGLAPFSPEAAALKAGRLLLEQIRSFAAKRINFAFETTLSGVTYINLFHDLQSKGYAIHLFFLWIPNIQLSLARIADRVKRGGHDIPEKVVRRRFDKGIKNLFHLYRPLLDSWTLFDNAEISPRLIAAERNQDLEIVDQNAFDKILEKAGRK